MKHTPGPWKQTGVLKETGKLDLLRVGTDERMTALIPVFGAQARPNMNLIAAAPELLEALRLLLATNVKLDVLASYGEHNGDLAHAEHVASKAIAKAEGK